MVYAMRQIFQRCSVSPSLQRVGLLSHDRIIKFYCSTVLVRKDLLVQVHHSTSGRTNGTPEVLQTNLLQKRLPPLSGICSPPRPPPPRCPPPPAPLYCCIKCCIRQHDISIMLTHWVWDLPLKLSRWCMGSSGCHGKRTMVSGPSIPSQGPSFGRFATVLSHTNHH